MAAIAAIARRVRAAGGRAYRRHVRRDVPILCLHRIGDGIGTPPATLVELLDYCAAHFRTITLGELAGRLHAGKPLPRNAIVMTFDDGTRDHFTVAGPALTERGLCATFAPIACTLLDNALPPLFAYFHVVENARGSSFRFAFPPIVAQQEWALDEDGRRALIADDCPLRLAVQQNDHTIALDVVSALAETLKVSLPSTSDLFMTLDEARSMVDAGHEMAGHSLRHQDVHEPDQKTWLRDLHTCGNVMNEAFGGRHYPYIYPFGRERARAVHAKIRDAGFSCAATTEWGTNRKDDSPYGLRRVGIDNSTPIPLPTIY